MTKAEWWNDYLNLPYKEKGRDRSGVDCWGLVRMVMAEQFDIELPSFAESYSLDEREQIAELIAQNREGWQEVEVPRSGDLVLFAMYGTESHVGIVTTPGHFLHAREGAESVVERLDSPKWKSRIRGTFRYCEGATPISLSACPHPLKTHRVDDLIPPGMNLERMVDYLRQMHDIPIELAKDAAIIVNGERIPRERWHLTVPAPGSKIEYRALMRDGDSGRLIAMLAIAVVAWYVAPYIAGGMYGVEAGFGAAGYGALGAGTAAAATAGVIATGINLVGALLVNAIFPVRPPKEADATGARPQHLLNGGNNQENHYGAVPVVLGRYRFTPPLAASAYTETGQTDSYLRLVLCWGYGPLQISDLRIGDTTLATLENVTSATLTGRPGEDKTAFNAIYANDITQVNVGTELTCARKGISSATRASGVVTVVSSAAHEASVGATCTIEDSVPFAAGTITEIVNATTLKFTSGGPDGPIMKAVPAEQQVWDQELGQWITYQPPTPPVTSMLISGWTERVLGDEADRIDVTFSFPEGLRGIENNGEDSGEVHPAPMGLIVQIRQLDDTTLAPITGWADINSTVPAQNFTLPSAWYNTDSDAELEPVYQWTRVSIDEYSKVIIRRGAYTTNPAADPSGAILTRQQQENYGVDAVFSRLPAYGSSEESLWDICVYGNTVHQVVDRRGATGGLGITGADLTLSGLNATLWAGTIARANTETVLLGDWWQPYCMRKDAFSHTVTFMVARGRYEVRARRTDSSAKDDPWWAQWLHSCYFASVTGYKYARPIAFPHPLAMTAVRVRATNQLNGNLQGITGTVTSICLDWDNATQTWVERPTRNPASLFRYVLQHPANAKPLPDDRIDLPKLQEWHNYCRTNGFMFDHVITGQQSLEDVLRDIAASGRASPSWLDNKRTVVIDKVRSQIVQHFTPHNSWGFEGTRSLPRLPHGFRVRFANAERGYQMDEMIVYNDGYSAANATLLEGLTLPGVTTYRAVFKHARFHFAQAKLRPETYTFYTDIEHLVCTRGDLIRVTHDIPMWGLGSARIKNRLTATKLELDEAVPMKANVSYSIRIRRSDTGASVVRGVVAKAQDGEYTEIDLAASVSALEGEPGNLIMFGENNAESVELIVHTIEPTENMSARVVAVDYSPAVYDSDSEAIPAFDSQITKPPLLVQKHITQQPAISRLASDESVMTRIAPGRYIYAIKASFTNPVTMPKEVTHVEGQIDASGDGVDSWQDTQLVPLSAGAVTFSDVREGKDYRVRLRYVDAQGRTGPWCVSAVHTVQGRLLPPSVVTGLTISATGNRLRLDWADAPEPDVERYEVRLADSNWGVADANRVYFGDASTCYYTPPSATSYTFYVKARDSAGKWSATATAISYSYGAPVAPATLTATFSDTSTTAARVVLDWSDVTTAFGVQDYQVSYGSTILYVNASTKSLPADWTGSRIFTVKTRDRLGNISATGKSISVAMTLPGTVPAPTQDISKVAAGKATVVLDWAEATKGSLPIAGYEIRSSDSGWGTAGYVYRGATSSATIGNVSTAATTTWYIKAFDTERRYSATARVVTHDVTRPGNVGGVTVARSGALLTMKATGYVKPADFRHFEFRIGQVRVGATAGDDTPGGVLSTGDIWTDPDCLVIESVTPYASISLTQFDQPRYSTAGVIYRVACRMVDTSGNESAASALGSVTVTKLS